MINWIIGGAIILFTIFVIVKSVNKLRNGKSICDCSGCDAQCSCSNKK